jgi:class 3 adenylate cyclase
MFSDLVGSTTLSTRMGPEDLREVISAYQDSVAVTVGRFVDFIARYIGDGVLVYFGYLHAHEHDAERAVRAGLERDLRFSNRPFGVKRFQTIRHCSVDVARGLVLLFGIGPRALP